MTLGAPFIAATIHMRCAPSPVVSVEIMHKVCRFLNSLTTTETQHLFFAACKSSFPRVLDVRGTKAQPPVAFTKDVRNAGQVNCPTPRYAITGSSPHPNIIRVQLQTFMFSASAGAIWSQSMVAHRSAMLKDLFADLTELNADHAERHGKDKTAKLEIDNELLRKMMMVPEADSRIFEVCTPWARYDATGLVIASQFVLLDATHRVLVAA